MNDENELLEPLASEAGQQAIVRAIRDISSLEYAVRAEQAASTASAKAGEASQSAIEASEAEDKAKDWATKTDGYVEQETITIPPEQEGEEPTTETINLYSAKYYAALAQDIYNNMQFDSVPTENSTNMVNSGTVYSALDLKADKINTYTKTEVDTQISTAVSNLVNSAPSTLDTLEELADALGDDPNFATTIATQLGLKADKSDTYTKTEVDTALSNVQSTLTFDNVPTANSDNPVKSSGIKTALDGKQDILTFDSTPTANSTNPVTSGGVYTALQNVNIDIDDEITEDSDNPVTSAAIYEALQNFTPSGEGGAGNASGVQRKELWAGETPWSSGNITLSNGFKDYDFIEFSYRESNLNYQFYRKIYSIETLTNSLNNSKDVVIVGAGSNTRFTFKPTSETQLSAQNVSVLVVLAVYGIKFSKNLSEQMYSNVLYEKTTSGWSAGEITLSDSILNYDFLEFQTNNQTHTDDRYVSSSYKRIQDILNSTPDKALEVLGEDNRFVTLYYVSDTSLYLFTHQTDIIRKIIGHKLAKGGYSGIVSDARMTVKSGTVTLGDNLSANSDYEYNVTFDSPMPDTNYIVQLSGSNQSAYWADINYTTKDKTVNGFTVVVWVTHAINESHTLDWIAIRPNSYTREGMVEDVLFSNASGVNSGTINLSGNISDYDLIQIFTTSSDTVQGVHYQYDDCYLLTAKEMLYTNQTDMRIHYRSLGNYYIVYNVQDDNTINIKQSGGIYITKITGIKFSRYVSGVAVDTTVTQNSNAVVTSGAVYDALQNIPSGGGSSITIDSSITQGGTNPVEGGAIYTALDDKADKSTTYTKTEVDTALASKGDVTTNTDQNITGAKTFVGSKKVLFKQSTTNDKLGFTLYGNTGTERGYLEFNPTNTIDGVTGLMTLGNYATSAAGLTQVGFRRYSNISGASGAYNLLTPLIADAKAPFSLTTTYQNFYLPLGFTDGTTTVRTAKSGVVDLSPLLASLEARIAALEGN